MATVTIRELNKKYDNGFHAVKDVGLEIRLPLPALPLGPGPLYPLDNYGPRADDNAVLRWSEQTLAAIRALKTGPTINARALAIVHTAMYDAWSAYDPVAVGTRLGGTLRRPAVTSRMITGIA